MSNLLGLNNSTNQIMLQNDNSSPFWEIKILLVETNPSVIRMVEKVLEDSSVLHFLRRIDTIHDLNFELKYNKPNLVLSGRTMEGFSAKNVLEQVEMYTPSLPVLVLAPDFNAEMNIQLVNQGAYDIIYHSEIKRLPNEVSFLYKAGLKNRAS
jgi:DNA-binding NtrC family response regulator